MVLTRQKITELNMDAISELIETKLSELKVSLLAEFTNKIDEYVNSKKQELSSFIDTKVSSQPLGNDELQSSIKAIQEHVKEMKSSQSFLIKENSKLRDRVEELEQYTRRPNLRIFGVPTVQNESSKDVEENVKKMLVDYGTDILSSSIDRAHREGKRKKNRDGVEVQAVIVRFTTFRDRTKFYKLRKEMKEKGATYSSVSLDLTRETKLAISSLMLME